MSKDLVSRLGSIGPEPLFIKCDLTNVNAIKESVGKVEKRLGSVNVLINNAASDERHAPEDVSPEYLEQRFRLNFNHHLFLSQAVKNSMAALGGGSIINMGSISWHMAMESMPGYTSSKAAIEGLTQSLARAYGKYRIRVNCIIPGQVWTSRQMREIITPEHEKYIMENQCISDKILPEDISQLALFLASDASRMCTRRNYFMDAGIGA